MPKFLVTSGSHFQPFTYDELSKPIMQAVEAHNATQDAYDTITAETEALRNYITDNPGDARAKAMYDDYVSKLGALQENLWANGYNAGTRRDLAAARAGYFSNITRLATVIKNRRERGAAWSKFKMEHPDAAVSENPASAGLDKFLEDDNYGLDFFNYSGKTLMEEVGAEVQALGNDILQKPEVLRNPELTGRIITKLQQGFSTKDINNAKAYVRGAVSDDGSGLSKSERISMAISALDGDNGLSAEEKILAGALLSRLRSTGAADMVNDFEFNKLLGYGELGMTAGGIQKPKYDLQEDLAWKRQAAWEDKKKEKELDQKYELDTYEKKKQIDARYPSATKSGSGGGSGGGSGVSGVDDSSVDYVMPSFFLDVTAKDAAKKSKAYRNSFMKVSEENPLWIKIDGRDRRITDPQEASEVLYHNQYWKSAKEELGIDLLGEMEQGKQQVTTYYTSPDGVITPLKLHTEKMKRKDAEAYGFTPGAIGLYKDDGTLEPTATGRLVELMNDDARYREQIEKDSGIKFSDYDNGPKDIKKIKDLWDIKDPYNKLTEYYEDIAMIKNERGNRTITPAVLVDNNNPAAMERYANTVLTVARANPGLSDKDNRYKLRRLNSQKLPTDDIVSVDDALRGRNGDVDAKNALSIVAYPELLEKGYLYLTTLNDSYALPVNMLDSVLTTALNGKRMVDLDGEPVDIGSVVETVKYLMEPFDNPEMIYSMTEAEDENRTLRTCLYLDPYFYRNKDSYGARMKDVMSDDESRNKYYSQIVKLIEAALAPPRETVTRLNFRVRGNTSDKTLPMFGSANQ